MDDQLTKGSSQLSRLFGQGIVTHLLATPEDRSDWSIDPNSVRNIPNIELMVILDDGRVAICCPDGLPQGLVRAATQIEKLPEFRAEFGEYQTPHAEVKDDRLDRVLASLEQLQSIPFQLQGLEQTITAVAGTASEVKAQADIMTRFDDVSTVLQKLDALESSKLTVEERAAKSTAESLADLVTAIDLLLQQQMVPVSLTQFETGISALNNLIQDLRLDLTAGQDFVQKMYRTDADTTGAKIAHELAQMSDKIESFCLLPAPRFDMTPIHQALSRQTTALSTVVRRIEALFNSEQATNRDQTDPIVIQKLDALQSSFSIILDHDGSQIEILSAIQDIGRELEKLAEISLNTERHWVSSNDRVSLRQQLSRYAVANASVLTRLEAVTDRIVRCVEHNHQADNSSTADTLLLEESHALRSYVSIGKNVSKPDYGSCSPEDDLSFQLSSLSVKKRFEIAEQLSKAFLSARINVENE